MMTKEQFACRIKEIQSTISALEKEKREIEEAYVLANREFMVGDTVRIDYKSDYHGLEAYKSVEVIVKSTWVDSSGEVYYAYWKIKKNGERSDHKYHADGFHGRDYTLTLIKKATE